ncbi:MAG TPA: hypothetical protein VG122_22150 [Gemmata sp.]|jgi:hypothetical protein|nr:hypothetical protein [Gemmata sp.]
MNPSTDEASVRAAARLGDTTAMRAIADFYRDRNAIAEAGNYSDQELATSYLMLAFQCEMATIQLNQIKHMLDWNQPPIPQILLPVNRRVTRRKAQQIRLLLRERGFPLGVDTDRNSPGFITGGGYVVEVPRNGQDNATLHNHLHEYLLAVFPDERFMIIQSNQLVIPAEYDDAARAAIDTLDWNWTSELPDSVRT